MYNAAPLPSIQWYITLAYGRTWTRLPRPNDPPRLVLRHGLARSPELTRVPTQVA
jgi:hypothetical protein